jgi:predicted nucleic acid-binding protein
LVKLFVSEQGSEVMIDLFERTEDHQKAISALAVLEIHSAIRRRQYSGDTPAAAADQAIAILNSEMRRVVEYPLSSIVLDEASVLIDRQNVRALDALHLATALIAARTLNPGDTVQFVASDQRLLKAAMAEGLETWDPATT